MPLRELDPGSPRSSSCTARARYSVFALQSRYFGYHGWNVLALDLPATAVPQHRDSSIEAMAGLGCRGSQARQTSKARRNRPIRWALSSRSSTRHVTLPSASADRTAFIP